MLRSNIQKYAACIQLLGSVVMTIMIGMMTNILMTIMMLLGRMTSGYVECHDFQVILTIPFVMSWMYSEMPFCFVLSHLDPTACTKEVLRLSHLRLTSRGASLLLQAISLPEWNPASPWDARNLTTTNNRTNFLPDFCSSIYHQSKDYQLPPCQISSPKHVSCGNWLEVRYIFDRCLFIFPEI